MTMPDHLICTKCGFSNVQGDVFCGSCGAFLEWEGVPATAPAPSAPDATGIPGPAPTPGAGASSPGPPPDPAQPVMPPPAAGPLVRCTACGIANAGGRTFCQSCGTKLPAGGGIRGATPEQIAAAVSAPSQRPVVTTRSAHDETEERGSRRLLGWLLVIGALGIAVGVGVVTFGSFLRAAPDAGASAGPGPVVTPTGSSVASGQPPSSEPSAATLEPSSEPGAAVSVPLALTGAKASSTVNAERFAAARAIDGDSKTSWQEGHRNEKGQWIEVSFDPATVTAVIVENGYNASRAQYLGNRRLRDVLVSVDGGTPTAIRLKDTGTPQRIDVPDVEGATRVRITIESTYNPQKTALKGSPFDDAALGEIVVMGVTTP